ncbi:hypothetical protein tpqmel_1028, partial [Candidatus Gastranaerophilus sp. (ex Termes propinquus)]
MKITNSPVRDKTAQRPSFGALNPNRASSFFLKHKNIGEATSIAVDFLGKSLLVPLVIMLSPNKKQTKEEKQYSAVKNPIAAAIQLGLEVPIFYFTSKAVNKAANSGLLDDGKNLS